MEENNHKTQSKEYVKPPAQRLTKEVLRSTERPAYPAVVGESIPPSGISGWLRRLAFRSSESEFSHWIPLLLADRINEVEGVVQDVARGKIPNIFAERGGKAEWKYNRPAVIRKLAVASAATIGVALVCVWMARKKKK